MKISIGLSVTEEIRKEIVIVLGAENTITIGGPMTGVKTDATDDDEIWKEAESVGVARITIKVNTVKPQNGNKEQYKRSL